MKDREKKYGVNDPRLTDEWGSAHLPVGSVNTRRAGKWAVSYKTCVIYVARIRSLSEAARAYCVDTLWRVNQRAKSKSGDGFFACIIIAVKTKKHNSEQKKKTTTTTKAIHLKWKITRLHLIGYRAGIENIGNACWPRTWSSSGF